MTTDLDFDWMMKFDLRFDSEFDLGLNVLMMMMRNSMDERL